MNARGGDAFAVPEFILGDRQLHQRFSLAIELLARMLLAAPRALTTADLSNAVGQPPRAVRAVLACLHQSGLLEQAQAARDTWVCPCDPRVITLADVFRSVASAEHAASVPKRAAAASAQPNEEARTSSQQGIELLLMQATVAINQLVLQHLQAFDLGRLKAVGSSGGLHPFPPGVRSYVAEPA